MAHALQCPKCNTKHPLAEHASQVTFACDRCGQLLKVPQQLRTAPPRSPASDRTIVSEGGGTRAMPAQPAPEVAPDRVKPRVERPVRPSKLWLAVAWIIAVFGGGLIVFVAGRAVGYLSGQRALDVVLSSGIDRYTALLPLVPVWAVVTTALVTLFVDGGSALVSRRRSRRMAAAAAVTAADVPPRPRRPGEGRRSGRPGQGAPEPRGP